jgi:hypothetical protein
MRATSQGAENSERRFDGEWKNGQPSESQYLMIGMQSFAKTRSPLGFWRQVGEGVDEGKKISMN